MDDSDGRRETYLCIKFRMNWRNADALLAALAAALLSEVS